MFSDGAVGTQTDNFDFDSTNVESASQKIADILNQSTKSQIDKNSAIDKLTNAYFDVKEL